MNILLTCAGRRVELLECFRRTLDALGVKGRVCGADASALAAAFHMADEGFLVPPAQDERAYVEALLDVCRRHDIGMVVPLIDTELAALADARERFAAAGARVLISSAPVVAICRDKRQTFDFLKSHGFATPEVYSYTHALEARFPLFMKPRYGSSARDVHALADRAALEFHYGRVAAEPIIQEFVHGEEYTVDVYAGLDGAARVAVPRRRLEVRGGEVAKAMTVRHEEIIRQSLRLVDTLAGCVGVVTLQCFLQPDGSVKFIEINPRFGGGVPLAVRAGADFTRWIIEEHLGRKPVIDPDAWQDGLVMMRYDSSVFRAARDVGLG